MMSRCSEAGRDERNVRGSLLGEDMSWHCLCNNAPTERAKNGSFRNVEIH